MFSYYTFPNHWIFNKFFNYILFTAVVVYHCQKQTRNIIMNIGNVLCISLSLGNAHFSMNLEDESKNFTPILIWNSSYLWAFIKLFLKFHPTFPWDFGRGSGHDRHVLILFLQKEHLRCLAERFVKWFQNLLLYFQSHADVTILPLEDGSFKRRLTVLLLKSILLALFISFWRWT